MYDDEQMQPQSLLVGIQQAPAAPKPARAEISYEDGIAYLRVAIPDGVALASAQEFAALAGERLAGELETLVRGAVRERAAALAAVTERTEAQRRRLAAEHAAKFGSRGARRASTRRAKIERGEDRSRASPSSETSGQGR